MCMHTNHVHVLLREIDMRRHIDYVLQSPVRRRVTCVCAYLLSVAISRLQEIDLCMHIRFCNLPCPHGPSSSRVRVLVLRLCVGLG